MKQQRGFTLIELVMVIVILGILAAVALPRFVDLSNDAQGAAVQGVAGALSSASAINYSTSLIRGVTDASVTRLNGATPGATLGAAKVTGWDITKYTVTTDPTCASLAAGTAVVATLTYTGSSPVKTATATIICTN